MKNLYLLACFCTVGLFSTPSASAMCAASVSSKEYIEQKGFILDPITLKTTAFAFSQITGFLGSPAVAPFKLLGHQSRIELEKIRNQAREQRSQSLQVLKIESVDDPKLTRFEQPIAKVDLIEVDAKGSVDSSQNRQIILFARRLPDGSTQTRTSVERTSEDQQIQFKVAEVQGIRLGRGVSYNVVSRTLKGYLKSLLRIRLLAMTSQPKIELVPNGLLISGVAVSSDYKTTNKGQTGEPRRYIEIQYVDSTGQPSGYLVFADYFKRPNNEAIEIYIDGLKI